ncbi:NAD-dependent deacetylase [Brevibacterium sp. 50QC2O2]|uniref:Sir2 family NAD-dependent protein deacetylase n=1 Tax=Brevibacterium sp. 50QC2O2 TaxID=2968459 RepID=UPI00211B8D48|nr:NAD-dependent deacetylase [Brevibacterium sp. 50QC2O2]
MPIVKDPLAGIPAAAPSHPDEEIIAALTARPAHDWVVVTGAGLSTDSGIPDYRGPDAPPRNPMEFQTFVGSAAARARYWARSYVGWPAMRGSRPNAGHRALAAIRPGALITQNVDGLHEAAGSHRTIDLHGRLDRVVCLDCGGLYDRDWVQDKLTLRNPGFAAACAAEELDIAPDGDVELEDTAGFEPLPCPVCGGPLKPDVVFFGESVPKPRAQAATLAVDEAGGLVAVGTSLAVMSGLRLVRSAARDGKPVVIVTDGPTRADALADYRSVSRASAFLSAWAAAITGAPGRAKTAFTL